MINSRRARARLHFRLGKVGERGKNSPSTWGFKVVVGGLVVGLGLGSGLTACASQDPQMPVPSEQQAVVTVGADLSDPEQAVLAEVYAQSFANSGRAGKVVGFKDGVDRLTAVRNGAVLVSFGCTGELLGLSDPASARELAKEYAADTNPDKKYSPEWRDRVYDAFSRSLPGEVMATDAGMAQACADVPSSIPGADLPQWLVPFYIKPALDRSDRVKVLNEIAGSLSTEDLKEMTSLVASGEDAAAVAKHWTKQP